MDLRWFWTADRSLTWHVYSPKATHFAICGNAIERGAPVNIPVDLDAFGDAVPRCCLTCDRILQSTADDEPDNFPPDGYPPEHYE